MPSDSGMSFAGPGFHLGLRAALSSCLISLPRPAVPWIFFVFLALNIFEEYRLFIECVSVQICLMFSGDLHSASAFLAELLQAVMQAAPCVDLFRYW